MDVRLIGEGNVEWTFTLPLSEVFADQVRTGALRPADEESEAAVAELKAPAVAPEGEPEPDGGEPESPPEPTLGERIDAAATHAEANELGNELGLTFEEKKPGLADKRVALHEAAAAKAAADAEQADAGEPEPDGGEPESDQPS